MQPSETHSESKIRLEDLSSQGLLSVLQYIGDGVAVLDRQLTLLYTNRAFRSLLSGTDIPDFTNLLSPKNILKTRMTIGKCFETGHPADTRCLFRLSGRDEWFDILLRPLGNGVPCHQLAVICKRASLSEPEETREANGDPLLEQVLDMLPDAVLLTTLEEGQIYEVNREFEQLLSTNRWELLGNTTTELGLWPDSTQRQAFLQRVRQENTVRGFEITGRRTDGRAFTGLLSTRLIHLHNRAFLLSMIRDISERKRLESELSDNREILSEVFENMQDVYFRTDSEDRITYLSHSALITFGCEQIDQMIGAQSLQFWTDPQECRRVQQYVLEHGQISEYETTFCRLDGTVFEVSLFGHVQFDPAGKLIGYEGMIRNISERKRAERILQEHDRNLTNLFNTLEEFLLVIDTEGRIVHGNAAVTEAYQLSLEELKQRRMADLVEAHYRDTIADLLNVEEDSEERYHLIEFATGKETIPSEIRFLKGQWSDQDVVFAIGRDIRDWIENQKNLRESEEKFSKAFRNNAAIMGICFLHNSRFIDINQRFLTTLGYDREDIVGRTPEEIGLFIDLATAARFQSALTAREPLRDVEFTLRGKQGQRAVVLLSTDIMELSDADYLLLVALDVTAQHQAMDALRLDEMRLETMLQLHQMSAAAVEDIRGFVLSEGVRLTRSDIGYLAIRKPGTEAMEIVAYSLNKTLSYDIPVWSFMLDCPMWEQVVKLRQPLIKNSLPSPQGNRPPFPGSGHPKLFRSMVVPVYDGEELIAIAGVGNKPEDYDDSDVRQLTLLVQGSMQILQKRQAEEEHSRLTAAIEQAQEAIAITDTRGRIVYVNPTVLRLTGYERNEVIGQRAMMLRQEKGRDDTIREIRVALKQGENWHGRVCVACKNGTSYEQETSISPVRNPAGNLRHLVIVGRDVTREIQMENQFRHVQKMEAMGQLAGGIAHDFNNVLSAIIGSAEFATIELNRQHNPTELLKDILRAADRASTLVRQLLTFSRKETLRFETVDMNLLVQGVLKMLRRLLGEHIELEFIPSAVAEPVSVDVGQIENALMNMCINARDAMPQGGKIVIATDHESLNRTTELAHEEVQPGDYTRLSIADTGTGIPAEIIEHIFEPFFTTKEVGHGTGLGLATVYGIVHQHRGLIDVRSEVGKGTRFTIFLPREEKNEAPLETPIVKMEWAGGNETILVAEDEQLVREMIAMVLVTAGYQVLTATNGEEAVDVFRQHANGIDLLLFDVIMPKMSGKAAADAIHEIRPDIPVLLGTGYSHQLPDIGLTPEEREHLIQKPYDLRSLMQCIRDTLDRNSSSVKG